MVRLEIGEFASFMAVLRLRRPLNRYGDGDQDGFPLPFGGSQSCVPVSRVPSGGADRLPLLF
jgi:hypothetical protein